MIRKIALAGTAVAIVIGGAGLAGTAYAATVYTQNGAYQFASNTSDYLSSGDYIVTSSPQSHSDSGQALGANGVDLTAHAGSSGYADSGVIVDLGSLSSLFNGSDIYTPPVIDGSSDLAVNFYFGTNGTGTPFTLNGSDVYTGADGNNYASMGPASGTLDSADFGTFSSTPDTDTAFTTLGSNTLDMNAVQAAYTAENGSEGVATANPQVWAWIGIVSTASATTGYVTSVDGVNLVNTTVTPPSGLITSQHLTADGHPLAVDNTAGLLSDGNLQQVWESGSGSSGNPANQQWTVVSKGSYDVIELTRDVNFCLDVKGYGVTDGTKVQLWACSGGVDQKWAPQTNGTLEAVNATGAEGHTMVLDDPSGKGNGTKLQIWESGAVAGSNGNLANQRWDVP